MALSFIKIDFGIKNKNIEKNIFKNSFNFINNKYEILDTNVKILNNYKDFNNKIVEINNSDDLISEITNITNFEIDLLELFGEGKIELGKKLTQYGKKDEKEIKELFGI